MLAVLMNVTFLFRIVLLVLMDMFPVLIDPRTRFLLEAAGPQLNEARSVSANVSVATVPEPTPKVTPAV